MAMDTAGLSTENLVASWKAFLEAYAQDEVDRASLEWPESRSVNVQYWDLDRHNQVLAATTLERPQQSLKAAEEALQDMDIPPGAEFKVRIVGLPAHHRVLVRDLRAHHVGTLIAVEGLVKKATEVRPRLLDAAYECQRCTWVHRMKQRDRTEQETPVECGVDGCKGKQFRLIEDESTFIDTQRLETQEPLDALRGGEQPQRLTIYLEDDLCAMLAPGDRVVINGVLASAPRRHAGRLTSVFDIFLEANSIEVQQQEYEEVEVSEEEEVEIVALSKEPDLMDRLVHSVATTIKGLEMEKLAITLQMFGGVTKEWQGGGRTRGDIHLLFVGDPGVAKSQLIRQASRLAPRGIYTSGKSASAAGLTAAVVRDETDGRYTLEAGALVLADKGICCIDEIDKMETRDMSAMHEAMEQQTVNIAKAGITAELQSRCAVLGAANPKYGRFDEYQPLAEQITLPPPLLSRFDCIFILTDKPNADRDRVLADHILGVHHAGEMMAYREHYESGLFSEEDVTSATQVIEPPVTAEFLRKYVAYAKRTCFPVMSEEARERLREYYVDERSRAEDGGPISLTARQLEALVRLSEASARTRLDIEVRPEHVDLAIRVMQYWLGRAAGGEGRIDIDLVASGTSHSQREKISLVKGAIRDLQDELSGAVPLDSLKEHCKEQGLAGEDVDQAISQLRRRGDVFEPRPGHGYKLTEGP